jgi:hypothetical protein
MQSGDYEHLLEVFDSYFGEFVILERWFGQAIIEKKERKTIQFGLWLEF